MPAPSAIAKLQYPVAILATLIVLLYLSYVRLGAKWDIYEQAANAEVSAFNYIFTKTP